MNAKKVTVLFISITSILVGTYLQIGRLNTYDAMKSTLEEKSFQSSLSIDYTLTLNGQIILEQQDFVLPERKERHKGQRVGGAYLILADTKELWEEIDGKYHMHASGLQVPGVIKDVLGELLFMHQDVLSVNPKVFETQTIDVIVDPSNNDVQIKVELEGEVSGETQELTIEIQNNK